MLLYLQSGFNNSVNASTDLAPNKITYSEKVNNTLDYLSDLLLENWNNFY